MYNNPRTRCVNRTFPWALVPFGGLLFGLLFGLLLGYCWVIVGLLRGCSDFGTNRGTGERCDTGRLDGASGWSGEIEGCVCASVCVCGCEPNRSGATMMDLERSNKRLAPPRSSPVDINLTMEHNSDEK